MKYKNCVVLATKIFSLKDEVVDNYGNDLIPPLMTLEGTITAVPNMQKQLFDYEIHWETNASLPVSFNVNDLRLKYSKGDDMLIDLLKRARMLYDLKYPEANGIGPLKLPVNSSNRSRQSARPTKTLEQEGTHRQNVTLATACMTPEINPNNNHNMHTTPESVNLDSSSDEGVKW